ncbi:MAG TPA: hypothetical protein VFW75_05690, partial [Acetobacteraceae bacterium]|nr:hypothetical protein [Acetobacteraceae bacterium]
SSMSRWLYGSTEPPIALIRGRICRHMRAIHFVFGKRLPSKTFSTHCRLRRKPAAMRDGLSPSSKRFHISTASPHEDFPSFRDCVSASKQSDWPRIGLLRLFWVSSGRGFSGDERPQPDSGRDDEHQ